MMDPQVLRRRQIRARTTVIAALDYLLNFGLLCLFASFGLISTTTLIIIFALGASANSLFIALVSTGKSESFDDPAMTGVQITVASVISLLTLYLEPQITYAITVTLFVPLAYGSLHLKQGSFILGWVLITISFGTIIHFQADDVNLNPQSSIENYLFALVVSITLGRFLIINAEVSSIRRRLVEKNKALQKANGVLREFTEKDELTGMANRQAFMNILTENCSPLVGMQYIYVALIEVGDIEISQDVSVKERIIRAVSDILTCRLRRNDTIARYDERQFALLLAETSEQAVENALERAKEEIAEINWEYLGATSPVTISIGVARWRRGDNPLDTMLKCEQMLYKSLANGDGSIMLYSGPSEKDTSETPK